jgi:hypothetical protein
VQQIGMDFMWTKSLVSVSYRATTAVMYKCDYYVLFCEANTQYKDYVVVAVNGDAQHSKNK